MDIINVADYDNIPSTNMSLCNCTNNENDIDIIIPALLFTIRCGLSFLCLISLMVYNLIKLLFNKKNYIKYKWTKILYPTHPVRCKITGPSECGKLVFLTNLIFNFINEYDKIYIYSPGFHQDLYQKLIKCFNNYVPIHIIPNILNEEDVDVVIEEIVNNKDFEKSNTVIETFNNIEELKFPQEYENNSIIILDDLNQKEMDDPRVQAMFKRSRHNILSIFILRQDYYELGKKRYAVMVISFKYLNRTISEMY